MIAINFVNNLRLTTTTFQASSTLILLIYLTNLRDPEHLFLNSSNKRFVMMLLTTSAILFSFTPLRRAYM